MTNDDARFSTQEVGEAIQEIRKELIEQDKSTHRASEPLTPTDEQIAEYITYAIYALDGCGLVITNEAELKENMDMFVEIGFGRLRRMFSDVVNRGES